MNELLVGGFLPQQACPEMQIPCMKILVEVSRQNKHLFPGLSRNPQSIVINIIVDNGIIGPNFKMPFRRRKTSVHSHFLFHLQVVFPTDVVGIKLFLEKIGNDIFDCSFDIK